MRRPYRLLVSSALAITLGYALAGAGLAAVLLTVDGLAGDVFPADLRLGEEPARSLLIALTGAYVTVVAIVFWVRIYAVQLGAGPLTSRVLKLFLVDSVQRHSMALIVGALSYNLLALRGVPSDGSGIEQTPQVTVAVAMILPIVIAGIIIFAVENAARLGQAGSLIRWLRGRCQGVIEKRHPCLGEGVDDPRITPLLGSGEADSTVITDESGWLREVDGPELVDAVAPGGSVEVTVSVGQFVHRGDTLCLVNWGDNAERGEQEMGWLRSAFEIGTEPSIDEDLFHGIRELVDIAERSLNPSINDTTAVREVIFNLGSVLDELLTRDLPSPRLSGEDGRTLTMVAEPPFAGYVDQALDRVRVGAERSVELAENMIHTIEAVDRDISTVVGESSLRRDPLRRQARRLLEGAERTLPEDDFNHLVDGSSIARELYGEVSPANE